VHVSTLGRQTTPKLALSGSRDPFLNFEARYRMNSAIFDNPKRAQGHSRSFSYCKRFSNV